MELQEPSLKRKLLAVLIGNRKSLQAEVAKIIAMDIATEAIHEFLRTKQRPGGAETIRLAIGGARPGNLEGRPD